MMNMLMAGAHKPCQLLETVNCTGHMPRGGKKDARTPPLSPVASCLTLKRYVERMVNSWTFCCLMAQATCKVLESC